MIQNSKVSIIAAIGENRELGAKNQLLWHIPGELARFKKITIGHPIIMGRKTFESIGRVLPGRTNIIITRDLNFKIDGAVIAGSLEKALEIAGNELRIANCELKKDQKSNHNSKFIPHNSFSDEIFIIGGGQIFKQAISLVDKLYLTLIHATFPNADVFFPDYSDFKKVIAKQEMHSAEFSYTFLTLEK